MSTLSDHSEVSDTLSCDSKIAPLSVTPVQIDRREQRGRQRIRQHQRRAAGPAADIEDGRRGRHRAAPPEEVARGRLGSGCLAWESVVELPEDRSSIHRRAVWSASAGDRERIRQHWCDRRMRSSSATCSSVARAAHPEHGATARYERASVTTETPPRAAGSNRTTSDQGRWRVR